MRARIKGVMGWLFTTSAVFSAAPANGPTWWLNAQAYSFHEHTSETYLHNTTPGLGLIRRHDNWLEGVGVFRNSVGRWAGYGYVGWQAPIGKLAAGPIRVGGIGGVTHHYYFNDGGIVPLAAAVVTVPMSKTVAIDFVGIPRIANATYTTLNLSLSWRFK
jgi:hypothetical protein